MSASASRSARVGTASVVQRFRLLMMDGAAARGSVIASVGFDHAAVPVHVMRPCPIAERMVGSVFVSAQRQGVEVSIDPEEFLAAAAKCGIGVEYLSGLVFEKHTVAGQVLQSGICQPKIDERLSCCELFLGKRHIEVVVEIAA